MNDLAFDLRFNLENEAGETFVTCELNNTNAREYIYLQANDQLTLVEFQESLSKYLELLNITQCQHLILDTRNFVGEWGGLNERIENELSNAKKNGLKYFAHIVPKDIARSNLSYETKDIMLRNNISYETFTGAANAVGWMQVCELI